MHFSVFIVLMKVWALSESVSVMRECCSRTEIFDYNSQMCVKNPDRQPISERNVSSRPRCEDSKVLVELEKKRNNLSFVLNSTLIAQIENALIETDSYCGYPSLNKNQWIAISCLEKNICEYIPCIRQCFAGPSKPKGIVPMNLPTTNNTMTSDLTYGLIYNCSVCPGKELELDPIAHPEHEFTITRNGSFSFTYHKQQLDADKYHIRYSKQSPQVSFISFVICPKYFRYIHISRGR